MVMSSWIGGSSGYGYGTGVAIGVMGSSNTNAEWGEDQYREGV